MKDADVIIIGSGMGALAAGLSLCRAGKKVILFEQHYVPGGWAHSFIREGHKFSPGVHFIGHLHEGGNGRNVFEGLGVANDLVFFQQNPDGYDHNIVGDHNFDMPAGIDQLKEKLGEQYPRSARGIRKYLDFQTKIFDEMFYAIKPDKTWFQWATMFWDTRHVGRTGWWKLNTIQDLYLDDPYVKTHLSLQSGNYALPPKLTPFVVHTVVANHCQHGTYYPRGGGSGLVKAFTNNIKRLGGEIRTGCAVNRILLEEGPKKKKAVGVELANGETYYAPAILSNADPHKTYFDLIGQEHLSKRILKKLNRTKYTAGALNLFMVTDMDLRAAGMDSGNIWYSSVPDLDEVFDTLMKKDILEDPVFPAMFLSSCTLKDPVSYDGRQHSIDAIVYTHYDTFKKYEHLKYDQRSAEYQDFKKRLEEKMVRTMEKIVPGISRHIQFMELGTPLTANHYINVTEGNIYGPQKTLFQMGPFNYRHRSEIDNLYLCGAATLSHGLIGSTNSGISAAATMLGVRSHELLQFGEGQYLRTYSAEDDSAWPDWLLKKREVRERRAKVRVGD